MADSDDEKHSTSDEFVDPYCDPCFEAKGLNVKVYGYCKDCYQFLCTDCHVFHGKFQLARGHVIVQGSSMPQSQADKPPKFDHCDVHPTLLKDEFCSSHKIVICSTCSLSNHMNCVVEFVEDACKNMNVSETDLLYSAIKTLQDQSRLAYSSVETSMGKLLDEKKTILKEAQALYDKILSRVNTLFQDLHSEVEANYQSQVVLISQHKEKINDMIVRLESSLNDAEKFKGKPIDTKLFLKILELVKGTNQFTDDFRRFNKSMRLMSLSFTPSKTIQEFLSPHVVFGSVTKTESKPDTYIVVKDILFPSSQSKPSQAVSIVQQQQASQPSLSSQHNKTAVGFQTKRTPVPRLQITATKQNTYEVKLKDDKNVRDIIGLTITENGKRVMVDYSNMNVMLFSLDMKFLSSVSVPDHPWDISVISNNEAAVSTLNTSLVILDISGTHLRIKTTTRLPYIVCGISKYNDKLVITCRYSNPPSVKLIDQTGRVYWSVSDDQQGRLLFNDPMYVSSHGGGRSSTMIVTDGRNKTLTLLNGDTGDVISRHQLKKKPRSVTTDTTGNIYVCAYWTKEVAVLLEDLSEEKILLSKKDGLSGRLQAIVYDDSAHQLIIAYANNNSIDCFKLS